MADTTSTNIKSYDAKDCIVSWNGYNITGFAEDMISASKDEEFFSTTVGAQGDVVVNTTNNPLGTITMTLLATSPQFSSLVEDANNGKMAALYVENTVLGEKVGGSQARIKTFPELSYGAEVGEREFEFQVFDYTVTSK